MPSHTPTTGTDIHMLSTLAAILELAASLDGSFDTVQQTLFEIEDRAAEAIHRRR